MTWMSCSRSRIRSQYCIKVASSPLARRTKCDVMMKSAAFTSEGQRSEPSARSGEYAYVLWVEPRAVRHQPRYQARGVRRPPRAQRHGQDHHDALDHGTDTSCARPSALQGARHYEGRTPPPRTDRYRL